MENGLPDNRSPAQKRYRDTLLAGVIQAVRALRVLCLVASFGAGSSHIDKLVYTKSFCAFG